MQAFHLLPTRIDWKMSAPRNTAMKAIVILGLLAFLFLFAASFGLKNALRPDENERVTPRKSNLPFQAARAMDDLTALLRNGSRAAGNPGHAAARDYILAQAAGMGLRVREVEGEIVGTLRGKKDGCILFVTHFDAFPLLGDDYAGANDGAAASAWLLEFARSLPRDAFSRDIAFVWRGKSNFSGPLDADAPTALVLELQNGPEKMKIQAVIYVDAIGDCYLRVARHATAPAWMTGTIEDAAATLGLAKHFGALAMGGAEFSAAFTTLGIPAVIVADPIYGGSLVEHGKLWLQPGDTVGHVCGESLKAVGDVLYHALPAIDGRLDAMGIVAR